MIQQVKLCKDVTGRMVTWIPAQSAKVGVCYIIQGEFWHVMKVYPGVHESGTLKRTWHVGGL